MPIAVHQNGDRFCAFVGQECQDARSACVISSCSARTIRGGICDRDRSVKIHRARYGTNRLRCNVITFLDPKVSHSIDCQEVIGVDGCCSLTVLDHHAWMRRTENEIERLGRFLLDIATNRYGYY